MESAVDGDSFATGTSEMRDLYGCSCCSCYSCIQLYSCPTSLQPHCKNCAISLKSEPGWKLGSIFSDLSQYGSGVTSDPGNSASDLKFDLEMNLAPQI